MIAKLAALALVAAQAEAAPEAAPCLPRDQAGEMAVVLIPSLIDNAARRCAGHLPQGAFLGTGSAAMTARLRAETAPFRDRAVARILELTGQVVAPAEGTSNDQMIELVTASMTGALETERCPSASDLVESLSPLPARNLGQMFGVIIGIAGEIAGEDAPQVCAS
jgi:hypothetical protein